MLFVSIVLVFLIIVLLLFYYLTLNNFWKIRNIKGPKVVPFFGNFDIILGKIHAVELTKLYYDKYMNEKMVGIFVHNKPVLILRDLNLIKDVMVKDFHVFTDRGIHIHDKIEPLSQHLFNLSYSIWRSLRTSVSPAFTGLRIKECFCSMTNIADDFVVYIEDLIKNSNNLECCDLMAKFMTKLVGDFGFSLKMNEFSSDSEFQKINKKRSTSNKYNFIRRFLREYCPYIYKHCKIIFYNQELISYYLNIINKISEYRSRTNIKRHDYIDKLFDLRNNQKVNNIDITNNLLAAQIHVFFTAGSDTTSLIISYSLYEIANNSFIQIRLRDEINGITKDRAQNLTFENINDMKYLDKVFKEILRKYPLRNIIRKSNRPYTFAGTNVTIPENTKIIIPHYAIHRDSQYYDQPEKFDPERFNDWNEKRNHPMMYIPFGNGPRYCLGSKFSIYCSKIIIAKIVQNFKLEPCNEYYSRQINDPRKVLLTPKNGINVRFHKL